MKGATNELTEIMSDNESYSSKQSHIMCSIRCLEVSSPQQSAAVTQQESCSGGGGAGGLGLSWWPQSFSISLSISWVITGAFDGLFMAQAPLL